MMVRRILVCGGRDYDDRDTLFEALDYYNPEVVISGGARGADMLAERWAKARDVVHWIYPARWKVDGKSAGPLRNIRMFDNSHPDLVLAFPGGRGTAHMVAHAKRAGCEVFEVEP